MLSERITSCNYTNKSLVNKIRNIKSCNFVRLNLKMIQRIQSVFMFFSILSMGMIMYKVPVLENGEEFLFLVDFIWAQISAFITMFLLFIQFYNLKIELNNCSLISLVNLSLSISFFVIFFQKRRDATFKRSFLIYTSISFVDYQIGLLKKR